MTSALEYIDSTPAALSSDSLEELAKRIAQAIRIGELRGRGKPRCDENGKRALVDYTFKSGTDQFIYTATFEKTADNWVLRGVRETLQQMMLTVGPMAKPRD